MSKNHWLDGAGEVLYLGKDPTNCSWCNLYRTCYVFTRDTSFKQQIELKLCSQCFRILREINTEKGGASK